jgi:glycosyltransferase involved in cell wall biosynthesis
LYLQGGAIERVAYQRASVVICNANHEVDYLSQMVGTTKAPVRVVHNGLELPPPVRTRADWRKQLTVPDGAAVVTMLANFRFQKDHATLLRSWRLVIDDHPVKENAPVLILAGSPQESFSSVQSLAEELRLTSSVRYPGQVQDVSGLLEASDIGVLTTFHEGLSNSVLEYMTCGLPVVATDIPGNEEALGEGANAQLCPQGDAQDLAEKLLSLITAPDLRRNLGDRNLQRARAEFSITKMCESMLRVVGALVVNPSLNG